MESPLPDPRKRLPVPDSAYGKTPPSANPQVVKPPVAKPPPASPPPPPVSRAPVSKPPVVAAPIIVPEVKPAPAPPPPALNVAAPARFGLSPDSRLSRLLLAALTIVAALPVFLPLHLISHDGVDMPFYDQWDPDMANVIIHAHQGTLSFYDLFAQHNEHRVMIPKIVYAILDSFTGWNQFGEMYAAFVIVCLTSLGMLVLCRGTMEPDANEPSLAPQIKSVLLWLGCNILIFTPLQYENWLWGVGLMNVMPMAWIVAGLLVAPSSLQPWWKLGICLLLATLATFSSGNGMLSWPLVGLLLAWSKSWKDLKEKLWQGVAWVVGFGLNMAAYSYHYVRPDQPGHPYGAPLLTIGNYILIFLGGPFCSGTALSAMGLATGVGAAFLILLLGAIGVGIFAQWRGNFEFVRHLQPWIMVGLFAVGSAIMAGFARAGMGMDQALSSRYATYAVYLPVSLMGIALIASNEWRRGRGPNPSPWASQATAVLAALILTLHTVALPNAWAAANTTRMMRTEGKAGLMLLNLVSNNPRLTFTAYHTPPRMLDEANLLDTFGYMRPKLIRNPDARLIDGNADDRLHPRASYGYVDQFGYTSQAKDTIGVAGWAIFPDQGRPADAIFLTRGNDFQEPFIFAVGTMGASARGDIVKKFNNPDLQLSGWVATFPIAELPGFQDQLEIHAWALDVQTGKAYELEGKAVLRQ